MEDKENIKDYLHNRLQTEIYNCRLTFTLCTISTIRWLQRYSHCYSIICSFFCIPLWIIILPIALVYDIFVLSIASIISIVVFIICFLFAPCVLTYRFSSCLGGWNPVNMCRYSLIEALRWFQTIISIFGLMWSCYFGSGEIDNGVPICCIYYCSTECKRICSEATDIRIATQTCTIL